MESANFASLSKWRALIRDKLDNEISRRNFRQISDTQSQIEELRKERHKQLPIYPIEAHTMHPINRTQCAIGTGNGHTPHAQQIRPVTIPSIHTNGHIGFPGLPCTPISVPSWTEVQGTGSCGEDQPTTDPPFC